MIILSIKNIRLVLRLISVVFILGILSGVFLKNFSIALAFSILWGILKCLVLYLEYNILLVTIYINKKSSNFFKADSETINNINDMFDSMNWIQKKLYNTIKYN